MANNTPVAYSYEQYLSDALATYEGKTGVNDLNEGGISVGLFEANAQMTYRATSAIFQVLRDRSIDRAKGDILKRLAAEEGVAPIPAGPSTGVVTITDTSFVKLATKIYAGAKALNVGTTMVPVSNTTGWPSTGSIYIGRGTPNVEGPLPYSSISAVGGYFVVNLTGSTVKFHNVSESVIVAQGGNRTVPANTVAIAPSAGGAADVNFATNDSTVLLDGENTVTNVLVTAQLPGLGGNVIRGAIRSFANPPFTGATVTNPNRYSNGRNQETDDQLRARVKSARLARGLGTPLAIRNVVQGAQAPDEQSIVTSNNIITSGGKTTLYIDDGSGYERKTAGVGLEFIVDSALGGETDFQLATAGVQAGIAKAFLISGNSAPFALSGGETLNILVGGVLSSHSFSASDFQAPGAATAYEVVASINGNALLTFNAATSAGGTKFYIIAKTEVSEYLQVSVPSSGVDAAPLIGFQTNEVDTLRLYKNNQPLSKDGQVAFVISEDQSNWSSTIANGDTLVVQVDNTAAITYTITNQDFINEGTFSVVSPTNSLQSWINVLNAKLTGVTATIQGQGIELQSNLGALARAQISIDLSSSLVSKGMFSTTKGLSSVGKDQDYQFSRNTGQIKLLVPLSVGDSLTAGSSNTAAAVTGSDIIGSTAVFANNAQMWILVDDPKAMPITTKVASGTTLAVSKPATNTIRYTSNISNAFSFVLPGDYAIIWTTEINSGNRLEGRVHAVTATTLDMVVTSTEYAAASVQGPTVFQRGFSVVRTVEVPQRITIAAGTYNINNLAAAMSTELIGATVGVEEDLRLVVQTDTLQQDIGSVLVVTFDANAIPAGLTEGASDISRISHTATYESGAELGDYPAFAHSPFTSEGSANPPDSFISSMNTSIDFSALGFDPNKLVKFLNPYGTVHDALSAPNQVVQLHDLGTGSMVIDQSQFVKRLRIADRMYLAYPLSFGPNDQMVVILDSDAAEKTFTVPLYRRAITNATQVNNNMTFNAYDEDSGPTTPFTQYFPAGFDFSDFQVLMQAKKSVKGGAAQSTILYRSALWGKSGERTKVAYVYPTTPNQPISSVVTTGADTLIAISLLSGAPVSTQIDGTTQWNITITPNTPSAGIDQVTFTYSGTGTSPNLAALVGGEYVTIGNSGQFLPQNQGTFRVSTQGGFQPTATSFTVQRPNGAAVAQSQAATLVTSNIQFFLPVATTAATLAAYVNANLSDFVSATIVNDGGTTGSGAVVLSTYENSGFTDTSIYLQDGLNWISSSNISGSPQFTLKRPLALPSDVGYMFNGGEELRFTPTTMKQTAAFLNVLAVSGLTTLSSVTTAIRDRRLQITTSTLGSGGSVQVIGGQGSIQSAQVVGAAFETDLTYMKALALRSQAASMMAGQLLRLQAANFQHKSIGISATSGASITPNAPVNGSTTIQIGNRQIDEKYFGAPRRHVHVGGNGWKVEQQGKLVCVSWDGTGSSPMISRAADFNSTAGGTLVTYALPNTEFVQFTITSGAASFAEVNIGDLITISNRQNPADNGIFEISGKSDDNKTLQVNNPKGSSSTISSTITITNNANLVGDSFTVGTITKAQGTDWAVGVDATATAANLAASLATIAGITATAATNTVTLTSTYVGSPVPVTYNNTGSSGATVSNSPMTGETFADGDFAATIGVQEGDTVIFRNEFNVLNQGTFRVIRTFNSSFWIESPNAVEEEVSVANTAISITGDGTTVLAVTLVNNANMQLTNVSGTAANFSTLRPGDVVTLGTGFNAANQGTFQVVTSSAASVQLFNPKAVTETVTAIPSSYKRVSIMFYDYDAAVPGDSIGITTTILGTLNVGTYVITDILDADTIVVGTILQAASYTNFGANSTGFFLQEGVRYYGYKEIHNISVEPSNNQEMSLIFTSRQNADKINDTGSITMSATDKLSFSTALISGLDSYRYDTGLLAEANRRVYGDPNDDTTYPGVSAAGAEIFIDPPFFRRVQIAVNVRVLTGVPFSQITEQVRNAVQSLIDSSDIGVSIPISSIVSAVNAIPGVNSVAISSPQYDATHDVIQIQPSEKPLIIDQSSDISVAQIGS
jgi:uncharacterized phage protein gp47/JayE